MWHAQASQWGCDHCRQLIGAAPTATPLGPPPGPAAPPPWQAPAQAQPAPSCPRCWAPGTWHAQAGRWGCDKCKTLLDPAVVAAAGQPNPIADAGAKVGKVFLWIVLVVALIAFKVWLRGHH